MSVINKNNTEWMRGWLHSEHQRQATGNGAAGAISSDGKLMLNAAAAGSLSISFSLCIPIFAVAGWSVVAPRAFKIFIDFLCSHPLHAE